MSSSSQEQFAEAFSMSEADPFSVPRGAGAFPEVTGVVRVSSVNDLYSFNCDDGNIVFLSPLFIKFNKIFLLIFYF